MQAHKHTISELLEELGPEANIAPMACAGKLVVDDSDPEKPWAFLQIDQGVPEIAYDLLKRGGTVEVQPHFDNPHITVIKNDEAKDLIAQHGDAWKEIVGDGQEFVFEPRDYVDLPPDGWDEMERVWFVRGKSPGLEDLRTGLGLNALPAGEDGSEQDFHVTFAVQPAAQQESVRQAVRSLLMG